MLMISAAGWSWCVFSGSYADHFLCILVLHRMVIDAVVAEGAKTAFLQIDSSKFLPQYSHGVQIGEKNDLLFCSTGFRQTLLLSSVFPISSPQINSVDFNSENT